MSKFLDLTTSKPTRTKYRRVGCISVRYPNDCIVDDGFGNPFRAKAQVEYFLYGVEIETPDFTDVHFYGMFADEADAVLAAETHIERLKK